MAPVIRGIIERVLDFRVWFGVGRATHYNTLDWPGGAAEIGLACLAIGHVIEVLKISCPRGFFIDTGNHEILIVCFIHEAIKTQVLHVVDARDLACLFAGFGERGQEHGGQDCDDGNHDQELDERERFSGGVLHDGCLRD